MKKLGFLTRYALPKYTKQISYCQNLQFLKHQNFFNPGIHSPVKPPGQENLVGHPFRRVHFKKQPLIETKTAILCSSKATIFLDLWKIKS